MLLTTEPCLQHPPPFCKSHYVALGDLEQGVQTSFQSAGFLEFDIIPSHLFHSSRITERTREVESLIQQHTESERGSRIQNWECPALETIFWCLSNGGQRWQGVAYFSFGFCFSRFLLRSAIHLGLVPGTWHQQWSRIDLPVFGKVGVCIELTYNTVLCRYLRGVCAIYISGNLFKPTRGVVIHFCSTRTGTWVLVQC